MIINTMTPMLLWRFSLLFSFARISSIAKNLSGIALFFAIMFPSFAYASDLTDFMLNVPPAVKATLPAAFRAAPTTANLTLLTPLQLESMVNSVPGFVTLPDDAFNTFTEDQLVNTFDGVNPLTIQVRLNSQFGKLPTPTISSVLGRVAGGSFAPLSISLSSLSGANIASVFNSLAPAKLPNLSPTLFSNLPVPTLSAALKDIAPATFAGVKVNLFNLPSPTLSSVLKTFDKAFLNSLPKDFLSGVPTIKITSILNGLDAGTLSSLTPLSGLQPAVMSDVLSGLDPALISELPSTLFSGFDGLDLNAFLGGLDPDILGAFDANMFSGLAPDVLGDIGAPILALLGPGVADAIGGIIGGGIPGMCGGIGGMIGGIGIFVPVNDAELNAAFCKYSSNFDKYAKQMHADLQGSPDSLRNIITGSQLTENAVSECHKGNNPYKAFAYDFGPWASSSAESKNGLPLKIGSHPGDNVFINDSHSLRCLLEEMVEWQKLGLSVQIHQLLKNYIADAQAAQLNNQLRNKISATQINYIKSGNVVINNGVISSTAIYNTNPTQLLYDTKGRQLEHALDQAAADPNAGNPQGSMGLQAEWRPAIVASIAENERGMVDDPMNWTSTFTKSSFDDFMVVPGESQKFFGGNFNDPAVNKLGGLATFRSVLNNSANSPLNAGLTAEVEVHRRILAQEEAKRLEFVSSGYSPALVCSGREDDPRCIDQTAVTPAGTVESQSDSAVGSGQKQVEDTKSLDGGAGNPAANQTASIAQNGLLGYDATGLQLSQTVVNKLVEEFYDTIKYGYFGINEDTTEWAQGTMMMIYDEMKFDPKSPGVVVTDGQTADPTDYGNVSI